MDEAAEQTRHDTTQLGTIPMDTMETTSTIPQKGEEKTETTTKATIREQQRRHITAPQRKDNNTLARHTPHSTTQAVDRTPSRPEVPWGYTIFPCSGDI